MKGFPPARTVPACVIVASLLTLCFGISNSIFGAGEVEEIVEKNREFYWKQIGYSFEREIATLNENYIRALERAKDGATSRQDLDLAIRFRDEINRISNGEILPSEQGSEESPEFVTLREKYLKALTAIENAHLEKMKPLVDRLARELTSHQEKLVSAGNLEGGLDLKRMIEGDLYTILRIKPLADRGIGETDFPMVPEEILAEFQLEKLKKKRPTHVNDFERGDKPEKDGNREWIDGRLRVTSEGGVFGGGQLQYGNGIIEITGRVVSGDRGGLLICLTTEEKKGIGISIRGNGEIEQGSSIFAGQEFKSTFERSTIHRTSPESVNALHTLGIVIRDSEMILLLDGEPVGEKQVFDFPLQPGGLAIGPTGKVIIEWDRIRYWEE